MLSAEQKAAYLTDGYLVLPGFRSAAQIAAVQHRAREIVDAFEPGDRTGVFSSVAPERLADQALIESADQVHCFFEEEAFDGEGRLRVPKSLSINKIGHALHYRDPVFDTFSRGADLADLATDLGLLQPQIWQSMVIFKQPCRRPVRAPRFRG